MIPLPSNITAFIDRLGYECRQLTGGPGFALVPKDRGTTYVFQGKENLVLWCAVRMSRQ